MHVDERASFPSLSILLLRYSFQQVMQNRWAQSMCTEWSTLKVQQTEQSSSAMLGFWVSVIPKSSKILSRFSENTFCWTTSGSHRNLIRRTRDTSFENPVMSETSLTRAEISSSRDPTREGFLERVRVWDSIFDISTISGYFQSSSSPKSQASSS